MRLVVLQPGYLPWLGYFDQLSRSDLFVHYDDVQYDKHGWRNRNRVRTAGGDGWSWLTVPVKLGGKFGARILDVEIDGKTRWADKHWRTLEQNYRRAPFFSRFAPELEPLYRREWTKLVELDLALTATIARAFGLGERRTVRSSELPACPPSQDPTQRLLDLCRHFEATDYFSGAAARDYLDVGRFSAAGVRVEFQEFRHPTYPQVHPGPFVSHLSAVDALFNLGPDALSVGR